MRYKTINVTCYKLDKHRSLLTTNSLTPPHQIGIQLVSMAIEIGIEIVIPKENDIRIVMRRTDMETDVIPTEIAIAIGTVIVYPIARCLIRRSMTIRCPVICPTHDPFPPMMTPPTGPMDMVMVCEAAAVDDMATVAMTIVIHHGIHLAVTLWVAIPDVMLQIVYSRTDDIVPHPWTRPAIPMRQTRVYHHPDVMMISYTVPDVQSPSPPNVIHQRHLCPRAAPVNMPRPRIAFR